MSAVKAAMDHAKQQTQEHLAECGRILKEGNPPDTVTIINAEICLRKAIESHREYNMLKRRYNAMRQAKLFDYGSLAELIMD
jgi:predicted RNase H-like nuclease